MNTIHLDSTTLDEESTRNALSPAAPAESRYRRTAIVLHGVLGLTLVAVFGVGLYMANLPFSLLRMKLFNWHKWAGMCFPALSVPRLVWRLTHNVVVPVVVTQSGTATTATGTFSLERLAFQIGQNEWADTSMLADDVQVKFKFAMTGVNKL